MEEKHLDELGYGDFECKTCERGGLLTGDISSLLDLFVKIYERPMVRLYDNYHHLFAQKHNELRYYAQRLGHKWGHKLSQKLIPLARSSNSKSRNSRALGADYVNHQARS